MVAGSPDPHSAVWAGHDGPHRLEIVKGSSVALVGVVHGVTAAGPGRGGCRPRPRVQSSTAPLKQVAVAIRGTVDLNNWQQNLTFFQRELGTEDPVPFTFRTTSAPPWSRGRVRPCESVRARVL